VSTAPVSSAGDAVATCIAEVLANIIAPCVETVILMLIRCAICIALACTAQELGSLKTDFEAFKDRVTKVESRMLLECQDASDGSHAISHIFRAQEGMQHCSTLYTKLMCLTQ
jgi:hypothetical protein